ncbi:M81 family metallopeptidase [Roseateles violae]|uniref:Microcystinase C n=1 Tax=Roseateles violae TaxID=3058042 RepID=A0ABT8E060_9BURK|nr:M81 family metallopeptidase [Pelomonas sp. PFR6]MDN3923194.1 M81 family metallopeptidase [Pelomonas sp. PFR6]
MKIFAATIATETNTFSPTPTGMAAFEEFGVIGRGDATPANETSPFFDAMRRWAAQQGHEYVQGLGIYATPGGSTVRQVYESLREELLEGLRRAMPVDAVILPLHGAMVAQGYEDCEGDLIEAVRAIVGELVPIGVELDLHCHLTERMCRNADVIVAYKEYPHTDIEERLREVWDLTLATARREVEPVTAVEDLRMLSFWHTTREPMRAFVKRMQGLEGRDGVLSISFGHGFPYGDTPDTGAKLWVVTDRRIDVDGSNGRALARSLTGEIRDMREQTRPRPLLLPDALKIISTSTQGPLVFADTADNAGGGAPGDSTFVLRGVIDARVANVAIAAIWDPVAVQIAFAAGEGASLPLRIGGKLGPASGDPVDVTVTVRKLREDHFQTGLGARHDCGPSAWVQAANGTDIVLISKRQQVMGTDIFGGLGIDLRTRKAVFVKSSQHFYADFAPIAKQVHYVSTPGLLRDDIEHIDYRRRDLNFWPRVEAPWNVR